jgi:CheY-like chemotaxis protein
MQSPDVVFDLSAVIDDACSSLRPQLSGKPVSTWGHLPQEIPFLSGDQARLRKILFYLMSHAAKNTHKGEVVLSAHHDTNTPDDKKVKLVFTIQYSSEEIPKEDLAVLSVPYGQTHPPRNIANVSPEPDLATIKFMIEDAGGKLWLESKPRVGTKFLFTTTFTRGHMSSIAATAQPRTPSQREINVLVVEDSPANQDLLKTYLGMLDCKADAAQNGLKALTLLRKNKYDLCLMDIQMPVMDGIKATQIIRAEISQTMPIIALTAVEEERSSLLAAGITEYIQKPINLVTLQNKISTYTK